MGSKKKIIGNAFFLAVIFALTIYGVFHGEDLGAMREAIREADKKWLIPGVALVLFFIWGESVILWYMMRSFGIRLKRRVCFLFSSVGFFFSCITPSATGGQPAQIFYMKRQKIDIPTATIILMLVTIEYKFVLVFIGLLLAVFGQGLIQSITVEAQFYLYLGLGLNIFCVTFMSLLVFLPDSARFLITKGFVFLQKLHLMKNKNNRMERLQTSMDHYKRASVFLRENKLVIFHTTVITFVQRILLFFVTYVVYRSFGLNGYSAITVTLLQAAISISVDMLPLPGGMGISEALVLNIFRPVFTDFYTHIWNYCTYPFRHADEPWNQLLYADHHPRDRNVHHTYDSQGRSP